MSNEPGLSDGRSGFEPMIGGEARIARRSPLRRALDRLRGASPWWLDTIEDDLHDSPLGTLVGHAYRVGPLLHHTEINVVDEVSIQLRQGEAYVARHCTHALSPFNNPPVRQLRRRRMLSSTEAQHIRAQFVALGAWNLTDDHQPGSPIRPWPWQAFVIGTHGRVNAARTRNSRSEAHRALFDYVYSLLPANPFYLKD